MRTIVLTQQALDLIRAHADPTRGFRSDARPLPDGTWEVPVGDDVAEALARVDPDPSRAIIIQLTTGVGHA